MKVAKLASQAGTALSAFFIVLLSNALILVIALLPLLGDHALTVPAYNYARETWITAFVLLIYSAGVPGFGWYWQRPQRRTARLIGMTLGVSPVIVIALRFLHHLTFGTS